MSQGINMSTAAIIVTYEPNFSGLEQLLTSLRNQLQSIIIVDNASIGKVELVLKKFSEFNICFKKLPENYGIAYAQNIGISYAIKQGATHFLLLDQDSIPYSDMVEKLQLAFKSSDHGFKVAAVGPSYVDSRTGSKSLFITQGKYLPCRTSPSQYEAEDTYLDVGFLISSGMLVSSEALKEIGGKRSCYFIDHVDTEWCFRAKSKGFTLLGAPQAQMHHSLGDKAKRVWFFGWRQVSYHQPFRDYYMFRNTLNMINETDMSKIWKLHFIWRLVQFSGYFLFFDNQRKQRLSYMLLGLRHGFCSLNGRLEHQTGELVAIPNSELDP